jgi:hypothetical protein
MEQRQQQQTAAVLSPPKLPAGLAGVLNAPEENRDSAYYSNSDASSKRPSYPCHMLFCEGYADIVLMLRMKAQANFVRLGNRQFDGIMSRHGYIDPSIEGQLSLFAF